MMNVDRSRRIANQVQQTLAKAISSELADVLDDSRLKLLTITDVRVTKDMRQSTIFISSYDQQTYIDDELVKILNENKGKLRKHLSQELNLRVTPELVFRADKVIEQGARMDALFAQLKANEPDIALDESSEADKDDNAEVKS